MACVCTHLDIITRKAEGHSERRKGSRRVLSKHTQPIRLGNRGCFAGERGS